MNEEQVKSSVRWLVTTFGGAIAGWFAAKGWFTVDQVTAVLNSPVILSGIASLIVWGLSMWTHTQSNAVAVTNAIPAVAGVVTTATPAGAALASSVPATTVAMAGTPAAKQVAAAPTL